MFAKYGLLALALILAWILLLRPSRGGGQDRGPDRDREPTPPPPEPAELAPCPKCGIYKLPGGNCDCTRSPASQD